MNSEAISFQMTTTEERHDQGLFGPGSITWKVWSHPAALVGLLRSFVVEVIGSVDASAALADRGTYRHDPIGRLSRTMNYFLTVVFGDLAAVEKANMRLNRIHSHIRGTTPLTGKAYSGQDPLLMLGTHLITWHSVYFAYEKLVGRLPPDEERRFFEESTAAARALGLDIDAAMDSARQRGYDVSSMLDIRDIPATRQDFARLMALTAQYAAITQQTRDIVSTLLEPSLETDDPKMKALLGLYPAISRVAIALTPREFCAIAGLPRSPARDASAMVMGRIFMQAARLSVLRKVIESTLAPDGYRLMHRALAA